MQHITEKQLTNANGIVNHMYSLCWRIRRKIEFGKMELPKWDQSISAREQLSRVFGLFQVDNAPDVAQNFISAYGLSEYELVCRLYLLTIYGGIKTIVPYFPTSSFSGKEAVRVVLMVQLNDGTTETFSLLVDDFPDGVHRIGGWLGDVMSVYSRGKK
ncbi:hypothetical protein EniLVp02_0233 [Vibrio phage EniLVp02]